MNKKFFISILILIASSLMAYGQQITFQKNINYSASALLQNLNATRDSLLLECKTNTIQQIDILSHDYTERIPVYSNTTKIDLKKLPIGHFVIQAKIDNKWIVMYLEKNEDVKIVSSDSKDMIFNPIKASGVNYADIPKIETPIYCWVVSETHSNFGSSKSMKLEYKHDVAKLITKNKLELQSDMGKNNKLLIYVVYDKSKFMSKQLRNPDYYKSEASSKFFDTEPYYASNEESLNRSNP